MLTNVHWVLSDTHEEEQAHVNNAVDYLRGCGATDFEIDCAIWGLYPDRDENLTRVVACHIANPKEKYARDSNE